MEENDSSLKKEFGNLGLYLVENAENEIKEIERKQVLLNSSLKKRKNERIEQILNKKKKQFKDQYHSQINESTVSILLDIKNQLLELKNKLITNIKNDFKEAIALKISKNYDKYINYLLKIMKEKVDDLKIHKKMTFILNSNDFNYLSNHKELLKSNQINNYELQKSEKETIGGYILIIPEESFNLNYMLENQIKMHTNAFESLITEELSLLEESYYGINEKFEKSIEDIRKKIHIYLEKLEELA
jgi:vacuolar-type H+-ATPase subunit E/Vma4